MEDLFWIIVTIFVALIVAFAVFRGKDAVSSVVAAVPSASKRADAAVIAGLSGAGKTSLYTTLRRGKCRESYTSRTCNDATFILHDDAKEANAQPVPVHIVDAPGHERLRNMQLQELSQAKAVVFVVDSSKLNKERSAVASRLYDVLVHPHVVKKRVPVCIALNKMDVFTAVQQGKAKGMLEAAINEERKSRAASLMDTDTAEGDDNVQVFLGDEDKDFTFEDSPAPVSIVVCSVLRSDVSPVVSFLRESIVAA